MTRGADLSRVLREGQRHRTQVLDVRGVLSGLAFARLGVIVPKYGHTGVERNRLKRRLREIMRIVILPSLPPLDLVVRALPPAYGATFGALEKAVTSAADRLRRRLG